MRSGVRTTRASSRRAMASTAIRSPSTTATAAICSACQGLDATAHEVARPVFERLFREFGLPQMIRTDNGVPFATIALARLSRLSVWWIRLGIYPELIEPGHPEQNGRHERMHRTLKRHTARPPAASGRAQQRRFNAFRTEYNEERPHEALDQETLASRYQRAAREYTDRLPEIEYPSHCEATTRESKRRHALGEPLGQRESRSRRRVRGTRRSRRRRMGRLLRYDPTWTDGRTTRKDRRWSGEKSQK